MGSTHRTGVEQDLLQLTRVKEPQGGILEHPSAERVDSASIVAGRSGAVKIPKKPRSGLPLLARLLRHTLVQTLLYPLEKATQNTSFQSDGTRVVVARSLTRPLLEDLFSNRILGIHILGWYNAALCERVALNVSQLATENWNVYDVAEGYKKSDVDVVGRPFNMAVLNEECWSDYFNGMLETTRRIRGLAGEASGPLDRFRLEMDEIWPDGLTVRKFKTSKMIPGLIRVMRDQAGPRADMPLNCHVDDSPLLSARHGLYSVNIYLKPPTQGGELFLWNTRMDGLGSFFKRWYLNKNFFLTSSYADPDLQRQFQQHLPPPVRLKIGQGDLVMLNTGRPHAIAPFSGARVSMQAFLTYRKKKAIGIWA